MAVSIGKKRRAENSGGEKREQLDVPRPRKRRKQQKPSIGKEVVRSLSLPLLGSRLIKPLLTKQTQPRQKVVQPPTLPRTVQRPMLPDTETGQTRPQLRVERVAPFPQNLDTTLGRKEREQSNFGRLKPQTEVRGRRREPNPLGIAETIPIAPTAKAPTNRSRRLKQESITPSPQNQKNRTSRQRQKNGPFVYIIRLLILGIGIGAIAGTLISAINPATQAKAKGAPQAQIQEIPQPTNSYSALALTQEIQPLKTQIQSLGAQNSKLQPGVFIVDLENGSYIDLDGTVSFASASTIKLPILVAFFQDVDTGKTRLDELLTMKPEMIADGSGDMQYKKPGTQYTALEVATKMMIISDNTATNMLIDRLGGAESLNQRFRSWGLTNTIIRNRLPDIEGTNTTTPRELASLMSILHKGELVSLQARARMMDIMQRNEINSLLPKGLGSGATIAHKTGNIGSLSADVGLVDTPSGKRYLISVMVKRPHNDANAEELIRKISKTTYTYFTQSPVRPNPSSTPSRTSRNFSREIAYRNPLN